MSLLQQAGTMVTAKATPRIFSTSGQISNHAFLHRQPLLGLQQQRSASAAAIALRASIKHPAHKVFKKPSRTMTEHETAGVSDILHAIDHRKQVRILMREKAWMEAKYV